jgi:hypothetical protein
VAMRKRRKVKRDMMKRWVCKDVGENKRNSISPDYYVCIPLIIKQQKKRINGNFVFGKKRKETQ